MNHYQPFYDHFGFMPPFFQMFGLMLLPVFFVVALWTVVIKGFALWHAAQSGQKWWFMVLLVVNTLGILEVIYLIWFRGDRSTKIVSGGPVAVSPNSVTSTTAVPAAESGTDA